ncbi:hypothetical protein MNV84_07907 [Leishmania braziliensis]|nr:hypothetical protein MNV84_07907 [Leishmania braziliensis]
MQPGVSEVARGSYRTFHTSASAARRPKTDYGILLEAKRRSEGTINRKSASTRSCAAAEQAGQRLSSPRWRGVREAGNVIEPTTTWTQRTTSLLPTPRGQCTPMLQNGRTSPRGEQHVGKAVSDEKMDDAASALLSELQQVVVRVSHQMVDERRRAAQQRKQIDTLETIVAEQDAMLDALRTQHNAAQYEKSCRLKCYQNELRCRGVDSVQPKGYNRERCRTSEWRISAAQVDDCVCAEFRRLSPIYESSSFSVFDEVSPIIAAVLRSLATQVLQLRCAARENEVKASSLSRGESSFSFQLPAGSAPLVTAPAVSSPSVMLSFNRHAPAANRSNASAVDRVKPTMAPETQTKASMSATPAAGPHHASLGSASLTNGEEGKLFCVDMDTGMNTTVRAAARPASEASVSVSNSVCEDAASILSDIRARYGL